MSDDQLSAFHEGLDEAVGKAEFQARELLSEADVSGRVYYPSAADERWSAVFDVLDVGLLRSNVFELMEIVTAK